MPLQVVNRVTDALNAQRKPIQGSRILLIGLAYKANVDDDRESPSYVLLNLLRDRGAEVAYFDPHVPVIRPTREHSKWAGMKSVPWTRETISGFDLALISTAHSAVNYRQLAEWASCIVDTRNVMSTISAGAKVWKA
jgi:UDP-N-acetyl-D-glucosamine dehydrogenase